MTLSKVEGSGPRALSRGWIATSGCAGLAMTRQIRTRPHPVARHPVTGFAFDSRH
jgi:hypothetical protein